MQHRTRLGAAVGLLAGLLVASSAAAQTVEGERLTVGSSVRPEGTTVRLDGLGTSGGTNVLFADGDGDIFERLLAVTDIPSAFTRDDVAETITQPWTFGAGLAGALPVAGAISSTAATGIPANAGGRIYHTGGYSSPVGGRTYLGDGTGWYWVLASRVSSTDTDRFRLSDRGRFEFAEHLYPFSGYTSDLAQPSAKMRSLHAGELFIETIVAQERITTMGGRFTVTPSNVLTRDMGPSDMTICVKYPSFLLYVGGVEAGSKIWLEKAGQVEGMSILSSTVPTADPTYGDYCYAVEYRDLDGSGANSWTAGDGIIDTGKIGSGMIDQFAVRGLTSASIEGPSIDFLVRTGTAWNALTHRASVGNLNGRYGYSGDTWGLAAGDPAATYITAEATNGFRIIGPSNTVKFHAKTNGDIDLSGNLNLVTGGDIKSAGAFSLTGAGGLLLESAASVSDFPRMIRWNGGPSVWGSSGALTVVAGTTTTLVVGGIGSDNAATIRPGTSSTTGARQLGVSGNGWSHLWLIPPTQSTMSSSRYLLIADTDGGVKQLTDGFTGSCSGPPLSVINGLIISC